MPLNDKGQEVPDQTPIVIRVGRQTITQFDNIKAYIRRELSNAAANAEMETFDEANDFEVDDDPIPQSPHEYTEEQEEREREGFEDAKKQAEKEFDDHVEKEVKRRLAARDESARAPKRKAPKQLHLQDLGDGAEEAFPDD